MGIVNKKYVYFDVLTRTDKALMLRSLADATVNAISKTTLGVSIKDDIAIELIKSLNNIRTLNNGAYGRTIGAGKYNGSIKKFESQYTPGLEFGIWKSTKPTYELTELAKELQRQNITPKEYISIVMFNYIQIINGNVVSLLKECIEYAYKNNNNLTVEDIYSNNILVDQSTVNSYSQKQKKRVRGSCRILFNVLSETIFFNRISNNRIQYNGNLSSYKDLIESINNSMIKVLTPEVLADLSNRQFYAEYITRTTSELINHFNKYYNINITQNTILRNNILSDLICENKIILEEDKTIPKIPISRMMYIGNARKIDFIEKNKRQAMIGNAAEKMVYEYEIERIKSLDSTLVDKVEWVSDKYGDGLGYDIKSINIDSHGNITNKYIEVKASSAGKNTPIEVTRNEVECSIHFGNEYEVYRLYDFKSSNIKFRYYILKGDLTKIENVKLEPTSYRLSIE
ncbi:DUF3883 domain-containing protein [Clostridium paraputrificum]|uniref:DUF3883 domain-containing protein n=1 Tax=Clostridium paraputrificum TaxID=29363 RepID=UPI0006C013A1|nr:DUF3883 domain-containing protein [Clostridium paraputrificum]CUO40011.1 Uncharacterised protein [Clostridium paraputrificum]